MKRKMNGNKRGWVRIVEAFTAILLIVGAVLIMLGEGYIGKEDASEKIYEIENAILREIQLNDSLRNDIISASGPLPINSSDADFPKSVNDTINNKIPSYLECKAKICEIDDECFLGETKEKDVYARNVIISSDLSQYNPRQLKLFCWMKEG